MGSARGPGSARTWTELARAARHPVELLQALAACVREDDTAATATALAYYFFFSIFPLLLFVLALTNALLKARIRHHDRRAEGAAAASRVADRERAAR
jgi:uncharacterized BrkB/YihY/UPF0761 family membrane protein